MRGLLALLLVGVVAWQTVGPGRAPAGAGERQGPVPAASRAACPVPGAPVTSTWGQRWGTLHDVVDLGAPHGTPIRAVLGGVVTHSGDDDPGGYGSYITVANAAGRQQYGHMSVRLVRAGQRVKAGQVIARVGSEGKSTGPHLHLRWYPVGARRGVDPVPQLRRLGVRLPCG